MEAIDTVTAAAAAAEATSSGKKEVLDAIHDKVLDYYNQEHVFDFYEQVSAAVKRGTDFKHRCPGVDIGPSLAVGNITDNNHCTNMMSVYHSVGVNGVALLLKGRSSASCGPKAFAHTNYHPTDIDDSYTILKLCCR